MNKNMFESLVAAFKQSSVFITQSTQKIRLRAVAVFLIIALLTPVFLFNPLWQIQAQANRSFSIQQPAPISAPPESFVIGSAQSTISYSIISSLLSVRDYFSTPELPEGFEIAKVPTASERVISSLGKTFGSIFGKISTTSGKETNLSNSPNPSPNNMASTNLLFGQLSGGVDFDFDGDHKADLARWHASNTEWKIKKSSDGNYQTVTIGSSSSVITPGDFDGDGTTDVAVFNSGTWTIKRTSDNQTITVSFGTSGDKPVVGDYDGDGKSDPAVFRPSTSTWWILYSTTANYSSTSFGNTGDIPVQGKFDGDAKTDIAVFRPSNGYWHIQGSTSGYYSVHWGNSSDIPVPADYTGDSQTDLAVYRGATGTWYVLSSADYTTYYSQGWGNYGDQPVPADYDGDGKADYSVWRPTTGVWYTIKSYDSSYDYQTLGVSGDTAISSAYLKQIGGLVYSYDFAKVRLSPKNSTGGTDLYSRNFSWGTSLVGLPGRAGLDAGFGISYNSLIWTKDTVNNAIVFDADNSNVTPGFRMGFPTIEPVYYDSQTGKFAYLMVTPSGSRVEFRQAAASNIYETADSSYTQLKIDGTGTPNDAADSLTLTVTNTSGANMLYEWKNGAYRCQKITDRNGNYITINHDADGKLQTVTDTLGRVITVNYNSDNLPSSITQSWKDNNGQGPGNITRTYATFTYTTQAITTNFRDSVTNDPLPVIGPGDGYSIKVLQKITFPTDSNGAGPNTVFEYNSYGQVKKINSYAADNHLLNYVSTNLDTPPTNPTDCPRFTETRNWVENFNQNQPLVVSNSEPTSGTYSLPDGHSGTATKIEVSMTGDPYNHVSKTFVGSAGWMEGLPIATEDLANGAGGLERKRWTWSEWTQDNASLSYIQNPRVTKSKVGDTGSVRRTETTFSEYGLVSEVKIYDDNSNVLHKKATTAYKLTEPYLSRRIIGLPSLIEAWGFNQQTGALEEVSKVGYEYDETGFGNSQLEQDISPVKHDNANFGASLTIGRGNLTSVTRYDVTGETPNYTTAIQYNTAGAVVAQTTPGTGSTPRTVSISYTDSFNDGGNNRNTYAYPTKLFDPQNNYSSVQYRFDTGANVFAESPAPAGNSVGKKTERIYDDFGRLEKEVVPFTGAYVRYEYPANGIQSKVFSTLIDIDDDGANADDEVMSETWTDGAGRVRRSRTENPNSTGGWTGTIAEYDIFGQVARSTVPTEIAVSNANDPDSWTPAGDDYRLNQSGNVTFLWTYQKYDWKGRVVRKLNTDGVDSPTPNASDQFISYDGCGCAGGQVTTIQSELVPRDDNPNQTARRTQKVYEDILGRAYKTDVLNWDGAVYTSTLQTFNGRDQVTETKQYDGAADANGFCPTGTCQKVSTSYDGHGRMKTRHYPVEDANTSTTWIYNNDDSIQQVIDPRGALTAFSYNSMGLVEQMSYDPPADHPEIPDVPNVNFVYDALGNRTQMTDGSGIHTYGYDSLSRLTSETKTFTGLSGNFTIAYNYHIGGGLKSVTDPFGDAVNYTNDKTGRLTAVNGSAYGNVSEYADQLQYRAWGGVKHLRYRSAESEQVNLSYDNRLRVSHHEVASLNAPNGFLMKADYNYFADSSVQAKDDQLEDAWDRTMKYDFAGRMNFNQFGVGTGTDNVMKRVYQQTIQYDAFSQMTSRQTVYWDDTEGYTATYANGRKQPTGIDPIVYDAAGNIVDSTINVNTFKRWEFDASGKQSKYPQRHIANPGGQGSFVVIESVYEYLFDGDGHPVIEKTGWRNVIQNPNGQTATGARLYQVWSSVLGTALTQVLPDGTKSETKIMAGSAQIAKQTRYVDQQGQNVDEVKWLSADPVTASTARLENNGQTSYILREEREPLGQSISQTDPAEPTNQPEPPSGTLPGSAEDPEWQCRVYQDAGIDFYETPVHCQIAADMTVGVRDVFYAENKKGNTVYIGININKISPPTVHNETATMMSYALSSTKKDKDSNEKGTTVEAEGNIAVVESERAIDEAIQSNNAEFGGDDDKIKIYNRKIIDKEFISSYAASQVILEGRGKCAEFFGDQAKEVLDKFFNVAIADVVLDDKLRPSNTIGIETEIGNDLKRLNGKVLYYSPAKVTINTLGPFLNALAKVNTSGYGDYTRASLESQILQILHEIGHLIYKDGRPLLSYDGKGKRTDDGKRLISEINTETVLNNCKTEIDSLVKAIRSKNR